MKGKVREMMRMKQYCNIERKDEREGEDEKEREGDCATHTSTPSPILFSLKDEDSQERYL